MTYENVEEVGVLVEIEAENVGVNVLKVFDGIEALKESLLEFQGLGKCG